MKKEIQPGVHTTLLGMKRNDSAPTCDCQALRVRPGLSPNLPAALAVTTDWLPGRHRPVEGRAGQGFFSLDAVSLE